MKERYKIDTDENKKYLLELADRLLAFGKRFPSEGGSSYYLGDDGTPWMERPRETWITSRMAHVYSMGYLLGHDWCGALADAALKGLKEELRDQEHDGWYAGIRADGSFLPDKQCYAHAFVILAASSGVLAKRAGAEELLEDALTVYDKYFWNEEEGLACDTWDTTFTVLDEYRGINANMHTVEAFLAVADVMGREEYRTRAGRIIAHVITWAKENNWRIPEHFTANWQFDLEKNAEKKDDPFKPYGATPGHGIEWARLILQWASKTFEGDESAITPYLDVAEHLFCQAITDAWNVNKIPGIAYTTDWNGVPVVTDRMHWTLAEAINTSAILYHLTKKTCYATWYSEFMEYLDTVVYDHKNGSWYHQLDENNQLKGTVWPGKSDLYHAYQAMYIPYADVKKSIALAIKII